MNNILIYGPPASGKTYLGKKLAEIFKVQFIDLDQEIVDRTGDQIEDIIKILGEKGFRNVEADIFEDVVFTNNNAIISLGGGALLSDTSKKIAETENVVLCLNQDRKTLECNFLNDNKKRPLCNEGLDEYRKLLDDRKDHYSAFDYQLTNVFIDNAINEENGLSNIFIGKLFNGALSKIIVTLFQKSKISIVYDENVKNIALKIQKEIENANLFSGICYKIKASEKQKNIGTVDKILSEFNEINVNRNDIVISIGGGITSDIVGFAASIWKRGIRWINIPTTLLSMVDASTGGKTGVNYGNAKNNIGSFHKPACVFIDYNFLLSLNKNELNEGYAEAYKHYLLDNEMQKCFKEGNLNIVEILQQIGKQPSYQDYFDWKLLAKFLNTKIKIVAKDPLEKNGNRAILNLGHTIGHAIEIKTKYKISHGNAVSIGICEELRLAKREGILKNENLLDQTIDDLNQLGLPTQFPKGISFEDLLDIMHKDKKNDSYRIKFILLEDIGKPVDFYI